jgi:hypothetical protein
MVKVKVANNMTAKEIIVEGETTVKECFAKAGISCDRSTVCIDGQNLGTSQLNKTLNELGVVEETTIMAIIKNDNAR